MCVQLNRCFPYNCSIILNETNMYLQYVHVDCLRMYSDNFVENLESEIGKNMGKMKEKIIEIYTCAILSYPCRIECVLYCVCYGALTSFFCVKFMLMKENLMRAYRFSLSIYVCVHFAFYK